MHCSLQFLLCPSGPVFPIRFCLRSSSAFLLCVLPLLLFNAAIFPPCTLMETESAAADLRVEPLSTSSTLSFHMQTNTHSLSHSPTHTLTHSHTLTLSHTHTPKVSLWGGTQHFIKSPSPASQLMLRCDASRSFLC